MPNALPKNGERLLSIVDEHWIKYVLPTFVYALFLSISVLLLTLTQSIHNENMWAGHAMLIVGTLLLLAAHHWFFLKLLSEATGCVIVTDKRLIHMKILLLLYDAMVEISFNKMKTVEASKEGLVQNILNYGTLHFEGTKAKIKLVPHPNSVARDIEQAMGMI